MIYLIGGAMRVGKSIIAKNIAEKTGASLIATDDVCRAFIQTLTEEERAKKFPLRKFPKDPLKNTTAPEEKVEQQMISAKSLVPELDRIVSAAVHNHQSIVLEGIHVLPSYVRSLIEKYKEENIHGAFIGLEDIERIIDGIVKNTSPNDWMKESHPEVVRQVAEFIAAFSRRIREEAIRSHLQYTERTEDFRRDVERLSSVMIGEKIKLPRR